MRITVTVSRHDTCFGDGRPCATSCEQCEKDGKTYIERVRGSEQGFKHLTEREDTVVSQDGLALLCFASHYSSLSYSLILPQTSQGSGCILALCLHFHFCTSLLTLSSSLLSQFSAILMSHNETASAEAALGMINLRRCTQLL